MRARFGINSRLEYYSSEVLAGIVTRSAKILNIPIADKAAIEIASRSRGTPRIANALLRRIRDFAQIKGDGTINLDITQIGLKALHVDAHGLDEMDNKILSPPLLINSKVVLWGLIPLRQLFLKMAKPLRRSMNRS